MTGPRQWLLLMAALCAAAVGAALVAQYGFDMQPCPWCILQRVIFLMIALLCVIGVLVKVPALRKILAGLALVLAALGGASAVYQHVVAAKLNSCNLTLADKILRALQIESLYPALFEIRGTCADAAVSVLGVPFEYWSLALFALLAGMALRPLIRYAT